MSYLKHTNIEFMCIFIALITIFSSFPAQTISGERTFGNGSHPDNCSGNIEPPPRCRTRSGGSQCPLVRDVCRRNTCGNGTCEICAEPSESCHPCRADLIHCYNQSNEECVNE
jgi:hypothetical protein